MNITTKFEISDMVYFANFTEGKINSFNVAEITTESMKEYSSNGGCHGTKTHVTYTSYYEDNAYNAEFTEIPEHRLKATAEEVQVEIDEYNLRFPKTICAACGHEERKSTI